MIELWLSSGTAGMILIPFVLLYLIAAGIVWLTHLSPARPFFASCIGIAGPFFASVAVLFSLFAAFLANDVQHSQAEAKAAVFREADGIRTILRLAEALGGTGHMVRTEAMNYAQWVLDKEFPAIRQGTHTEDLSALRDLNVAVLTSSLAATAPPAVFQAIVDGLIEVRQAHMERLMLAAGPSDRMGWLAMLALGVLTQVAVAVVQLERLRPQALALFVFTTAFAATVVMIGLGEQPFSRGLIDDLPLRAAVASSILGRL
jgi:hypothetical protein